MNKFVNILKRFKTPLISFKTASPRCPGNCGKVVPSSPRRERGAVAVEYALGMVIAAAIMITVEPLLFRPMAKEILELFNKLVSPPYP